MLHCQVICFFHGVGVLGLPPRQSGQALGQGQTVDLAVAIKIDVHVLAVCTGKVNSTSCELSIGDVVTLYALATATLRGDGLGNVDVVASHGCVSVLDVEIAAGITNQSHRHTSFPLGEYNVLRLMRICQKAG